MKNRKIYTAVAAALTLSIGALTGCGAGETKAVEKTETQTAEKTETEVGTTASSDEVEKIYVAHTQTYVPYDFVNEKGESDGYEVQVLKAIDEALPQYEFEFVPTTDDDLLIGVESGKYNIGVKGAWFTEERASKFKFPENYIGASSIGIVYRTENADEITDFESFAEFSGKLVPIAPQNAQYAIVEKYNEAHPDNQVELEAADSFDVSDAYLWVLEGRYDAFFNIKTSFETNVVAEDGQYHQYADQLSYSVYQAIPTYPLFNLEDEELAAAYDKAFEQLKADGTIEELELQYFGEDLFQYIAE
ncbi:transporter substrate-binding domain-containing protein [Anaerobium acetethylicum]|uniref:L-cystine transport system substrate-binding protein n=1 Tax=Anaerobium acetethylicum TaxID=1619234 RepID=A0A1D3TVK4_9FIRM|nr:transporter substrate-binding domain-containing protein [Anaerobium acetethylicum]SCP98170.1 L-cystine transport system substrate-binding protein [Anaerobium acetethylicum]